MFNSGSEIQNRTDGLTSPGRGQSGDLKSDALLFGVFISETTLFKRWHFLNTGREGYLNVCLCSCGAQALPKGTFKIVNALKYDGGQKKAPPDPAYSLDSRTLFGALRIQ